jgi:hypothetical protein
MARKEPHPGDLTKVIRRLATEGQVAYSFHAFHERSDERNIDMQDALAVLRHGMIKGEIIAGNNPGEWKCKVVDTLDRSSRAIGVVIVVMRSERLLIVTVEWEDK